ERFHKNFEAFNEIAYLEIFPEVSALLDEGEINSVFDHFCEVGYLEIISKIFEGRKTASKKNESTGIPQAVIDAFDTEYYLKCNPDVQDNDINPLIHYYFTGWREGRKPNEWFDPAYYIKNHADVFELDIDPLFHYLEFGKDEGRKPALILNVERSSFFNHINKQTYKSEYHQKNTAFKKYDLLKSDIKAIAFYLPQFHPIAENDKAWGKGFTEWTNVCKALPQFEGHYQPRLPGELGHYDLRLLDVQKRQIELAKNYGLHGFCYHYYWFNGKKVLEKPLEQLLEHPELDFPFCVNWANENWTKKWDGLDNDVILYQEYSEDDDLEFIEDVSRLFKDPRYIHIDGKPLLMIYRPVHFPNIKKTVKGWRKWCLENGIGEIYLMMTHSFEHIDPNEVGFDGATEFYPNSIPVHSIKDQLTFFNENYEGHVYDYKELIEISNAFKAPNYRKYRSLCPSWDNEARKPGKGSTYYFSTPELYQSWLENLCRYTEDNFKEDEKLIFINAWNEWGEGAYLEPDQKFGYGYLDATYQALLNYKKEKKKIIYVSHDANFHGAQLLSLNIVRVLHDLFNLDVQMILKT
ncbi:MAG: glycoside hydrolase family 99-like domain-containing protein, partial [Bacteroidales bacterium]|nr:glycoside hydrolase family 99-like domain-containing protein [Bacteroidales bacterium]